MSVRPVFCLSAFPVAADDHYEPIPGDYNPQKLRTFFQTMFLPAIPTPFSGA